MDLIFVKANIPSDDEGKEVCFVAVSEDVQKNESIEKIVVKEKFPVTEDNGAIVYKEECVIYDGDINCVEHQRREGSDVQLGTMTPDGFITWQSYDSVDLGDGFVHINDISDWLKYNYEKCREISNSSLGRNLFLEIPGYSFVNMLNPEYDLILRNSAGNYKFTSIIPEDSPIEIQRLSSQRLFDSTGPGMPTLQWVDVADLENEDDHDWSSQGNYIFRSVGHIDGFPIPGWKPWDQGDYHQIEIETFGDLHHFITQTSQFGYKIRINGIVPSTVEYLYVYDSLGNRHDMRPVIRDDRNEYNDTFQINVKPSFRNEDIKKIKFEFHYISKSPPKRTHIITKTVTVDRHRGLYPILLLHHGNSQPAQSEFELIIEDPGDLLYYPNNAADIWGAPENEDWNQAVRSGKLIVRLNIQRREGTNIVNFGSWIVNVTNQTDPEFMVGSPFVPIQSYMAKPNQRYPYKSGKFLHFIFKDSSAFRALAGVEDEDPDIDKQEYIFRLEIWSAGIENTLIQGEIVPYQVSISPDPDSGRVESPRVVAYDPWEKEHPIRLFGGYNAPKYNSNFDKWDNLLYPYGSQCQALIRYGESVESPPTFDFEISKAIWKYLYFFDAEKQFLQLYPYVNFQIEMPGTTKQYAEKITVSLRLEGEMATYFEGWNGILGIWAPNRLIDIIDFLGFNLELEYHTMKLIQDFIDAMNSGDSSGGTVATGEGALMYYAAGETLQAQLLQLILTEIYNEMLVYEVEVTWIGGSTTTRQVPIQLEVPEIPDQYDNLFFQIGNSPPLINDYGGTEHDMIDMNQWADWLAGYGVTGGSSDSGAEMTERLALYPGGYSL